MKCKWLFAKVKEPEKVKGIAASHKPFEVQKIRYLFDKYSRKLIREPEWRHHKYYKTIQAATDAIRDWRNDWYDKAYTDYPGKGNEEKYPHITPRIQVCRYRIIKRF